MKEKIVAKRYAEAFIAHAKESIGVDRAAEEFKWLKMIAHDNPGMEEFFDNPGILDREKYEFTDNIFKDVFSQELRDFLKLLVENRRTGLLFDIADYIRVTYARNEAQDAVLKSAYPLDLDVISGIKERLEKKFGRKLNFYLDLDGGLLGGVQVVIGNTVLDGSLKRRLDDLKEKLERG